MRKTGDQLAREAREEAERKLEASLQAYDKLRKRKLREWGITEEEVEGDPEQD